MAPASCRFIFLKLPKRRMTMFYAFGGKIPQADPTAFVSESAEIIGDVKIGVRCYIGPHAVIRADAAEIVIEDEVAVEDHVVIHAAEKCVIARRSTIGHGAIVHAKKLGAESSIGMGAILSLGCEIGEGSIVAEAALVPQKKTVPPDTLVAGIPAKPLRPLGQADRDSWQATKNWYVRLTERYLDHNDYFPVSQKMAYTK